MKKLKRNVCIHCTRPFWAGYSGLDHLLKERYQFLCRCFDNVRVLFVTPTDRTCPLPGITARIPRKLTAEDIISIRGWCEGNRIDTHYAFLDQLAGIIEHLPGLKICEISDVWHLRQEAFAKFGYEHGGDKHDELASMRAYDCVLTLNPAEAEYLRKNGINGARHLFPGTFFEAIKPVASAAQAGMIGSLNHANEDGVEQLNGLLHDLEDFLLAGKICESPSVLSLPREKITSVGLVPEVKTFYQGVRSVVSPVRFGSGLKIKVLEALSAGKPILATSHSIEGFPEGISELVAVKDEPAGWKREDLARALDIQNPMRQSDYINEYFSDSALRREIAKFI